MSVVKTDSFPSLFTEVLIMQRTLQTYHKLHKDRDFRGHFGLRTIHVVIKDKKMQIP